MVVLRASAQQFSLHEELVNQLFNSTGIRGLVRLS